MTIREEIIVSKPHPKRTEAIKQLFAIGCADLYIAVLKSVPSAFTNVRYFGNAALENLKEIKSTVQYDKLHCVVNILSHLVEVGAVESIQTSLYQCSSASNMEILISSEIKYRFKEDCLYV